MSEDLRGRDIIDSRSVIERIKELEAEREPLAAAVEVARETLNALPKASADDGDALAEIAAAQDALDDAEEALFDWDDGEEGDELKALKDLAEDGEQFPDWRHGTALIVDWYFEDYAREMAEDLHGDAVRDAHWPFNHIDWEAAANALKMDYGEVTFDGETYLVRR